MGARAGARAGSIIYDGFSYRLDRTRGKVIFWRCTKSKCNARIRTDDTKYVVIDTKKNEQ